MTQFKKARINKMQLEFNNEGEILEMGSLQEVQGVLKEVLCIESEINEGQCRLGLFEFDGYEMEKYTVAQLESTARTIIDYLRRSDDIFDVDYDLCGEYPIELIVIFE